MSATVHGDLEVSVQTKLLRVLRARRRYADDHPKARIIAATARSSVPRCLYNRLAVIEIDIPPLRNRRSDIPLLIAHAQ